MSHITSATREEKMKVDYLRRQSASPSSTYSTSNVNLVTSVAVDSIADGNVLRAPISEKRWDCDTPASIVNVMSPDTTCPRQNEQQGSNGVLTDSAEINDGPTSSSSSTKQNRARENNLRCRPIIRKPKMQYSCRMLEVLEASFQRKQYPTREDREQLEQLTQLPADKVKIWFQNRRCKARKQCRQPAVSSAAPVPVSMSSSRTSTVHWPGTSLRSSAPGYNNEPQTDPLCLVRDVPKSTAAAVASSMETLDSTYQHPLMGMYDNLSFHGGTPVTPFYQNYFGLPYLYGMQTCPYGYHPCGCRPVGAGLDPADMWAGSSFGRSYPEFDAYSSYGTVAGLSTAGLVTADNPVPRPVDSYNHSTAMINPTKLSDRSYVTRGGGGGGCGGGQSGWYEEKTPYSRLQSSHNSTANMITESGSAHPVTNDTFPKHSVDLLSANCSVMSSLDHCKPPGKLDIVGSIAGEKSAEVGQNVSQIVQSTKEVDHRTANLVYSSASPLIMSAKSADVLSNLCLTRKTCMPFIGFDYPQCQRALGELHPLATVSRPDSVNSHDSSSY